MATDHLSDEAKNGRYLAERAHKRREVLIDEYNNASWAAGNAALKAGMLVNGGAVVALLAFLSTLLQGDGGSGSEIESFSISLTCFALGTGFSGIATGLVNWRHFANSKAESEKDIDFEPPFVHATELSTRWSRRALVLQVLAVVCGAITIVLFFSGVFLVQDAMIGLGGR